MSERKRRKLGEVEQEISVCKANLSLSEGKIIGSMAHSGPPGLSTPTKDSLSTAHNDEVILFIKNITKLRDTLEEKNALLEAESDRATALLEAELNRLRTEAKAAAESSAAWERACREKEEQLRVLSARLGEKEKELGQANQQLRHYRQESAEAKLQNKSLRADNKVIMGHLDRLTHQLQNAPSAPKATTIEERELRVMRSLYQDSLPEVELRESQRRTGALEEPRFRVAAEEAVQRNGELKAVIRRLTEEAEVLRREKELLAEENRQKHLNLESQKQLVALAEQEKARQDSLIRKMGDKIMTLEEINHTLRQAAQDDDDDTQQDSYYRTTRTKAGQFYYRK